MNDKNKIQEAGDNSNNYQAENIVINQANGLSYQDAKALAQDVFNANFLVLKEEAGRIAAQRAEDFLDRYLSNAVNNKNIFATLSMPDTQMALYNAQMQYAKHGDSSVADVLIELLTMRVDFPVRNLQQIIIDESLSIIPKLTEGHLDFLSIMVLAKYSNWASSIENHEELNNFLEVAFKPLANSLVYTNSWSSHLVVCDCLRLEKGRTTSLTEYIVNQNKNLFITGVTRYEFEKEFNSLENYEWLMMLCPHNKSSVKTYQTRAKNENHLKALIREQGLNKLDKVNSFKIYPFIMNWVDGEKNTSAIYEKGRRIFSKHEFMRRIDKVVAMLGASNWLTEAGIKIGHANLKLKTGIDINVAKKELLEYPSYFTAMNYYDHNYRFDLDNVSI